MKINKALVQELIKNREREEMKEKHDEILQELCSVADQRAGTASMEVDGRKIEYHTPFEIAKAIIFWEAEKASRFKRDSLESLTNIVSGYMVSLIIQWILFPILGMAVPLSSNFLISLAFTIASLARSFTIRRVFRAIETRKEYSEIISRASNPDDSDGEPDKKGSE